MTVWMVMVAKARLTHNGAGLDMFAEVEDWGVFQTKREACDAVRVCYSGTSDALKSFLESDRGLFATRSAASCIEIIETEVGGELGGETL